MSDLLQIVLNNLGVEVNEEFYIINDCGVKRDEIFRINKYASVQYKHDDSWFSVTGAFSELINGRYKIEKKPFEPKNNERYWSYAFFSQENDWYVVWTNWSDSLADYMRLQLGICFRTEKEALENRPRFYKELTGKEWQGE